MDFILSNARGYSTKLFVYFKLALQCIYVVFSIFSGTFLTFVCLHLQVHERADECVRADNLLKKIHMGNFPPNLLNDTSVLQQLKVHSHTCTDVSSCLQLICEEGGSNTGIVA